MAMCARVQRDVSLWEISEIFCRHISPDDIIEALPAFGRRIPGFDSGDTAFAGIEARDFLTRKEYKVERMGVCECAGIYPAGEGAGYAGGIMSAAIDGIKAAESYIKG